MSKSQKFFVNIEQIKSLVRKMGGCFVTDMISVNEQKINFMYREVPDENRPDSGWRFFAGFEDDKYINDPKNTHIFEVNTVANYDPDIISFLDSPYNTAFERNQETGKFEQVFDFEFPQD